MKLVARRKAEQNKAALDPWTTVHLSAGLALGLMDVSLRRTLIASAIYELLEQYLERKDWGQRLFKTSGPEILPNALLDMVAVTIGHRLGAWWNRTGEATRSA